MKEKKGRPYITGKPKSINLSVRLDVEEHQELQKKQKKAT